MKCIHWRINGFLDPTEFATQDDAIKTAQEWVENGREFHNNPVEGGVA